MTLAELLNSDVNVTALASLARRGLAWWLDELAMLLPPAWRERLSSRPSAWIEPRQAGGWRVWKAGRTWEAPAGALSGIRVGLLAPPGMVLTREVMIPPMSAADARQMLTLDMDRLSPLAPHLIHFDIEMLDRGEDGRQRILLGIVEREVAQRLFTDAVQAGFAPIALGSRAGPDGEPPRFDFLPKVRDAVGASRDRVAYYAWIAAAILILVNVGAVVGRDMIDVSRLRTAVDAQRPSVEMVQRLRRRLGDEEGRRRDMIAQGLRGDPSRVLDALTRTLPEGVFVQHLEWNGHSLRLIGFERGEGDLTTFIRSAGPFANPKVSLGAAPTGAGLGRPFDLTADARPASRP